MHRKIFILILVLVPLMSYARKSNRSFAVVNFNLSNSYSSSGQGMSTTVNFGIDKGIQGIEFGAVLQTLEYSFSGFHFNYKFYLEDIKIFERKRAYKKFINYKPFLHYSMFFNSSKVETTELRFVDLYNKEIFNTTKKTNTIEWYLGPAMNLHFRNKMYANVIFGYGAYVTSYEDANYGRSTMGTHSEKSGTTPFFELSVGYNIE